MKDSKKRTPNAPEVYERMAKTQKARKHPWRKPFMFGKGENSYVQKL